MLEVLPIVREKLIRKTVVMVPVYRERVLLFRRTYPRAKSYIDMKGVERAGPPLPFMYAWEFPQGGTELEDASDVRTALRELKEELEDPIHKMKGWRWGALRFLCTRIAEFTFVREGVHYDGKEYLFYMVPVLTIPRRYRPLLGSHTAAPLPAGEFYGGFKAFRYLDAAEAVYRSDLKPEKSFYMREALLILRQNGLIKQ